MGGEERAAVGTVRAARRERSLEARPDHLAVDLAQDLDRLVHERVAHLDFDRDVDRRLQEGDALSGSRLRLS